VRTRAGGGAGVRRSRPRGGRVARQPSSQASFLLTPRRRLAGVEPGSRVLQGYFNPLYVRVRAAETRGLGLCQHETLRRPDARRLLGGETRRHVSLVVPSRKTNEREKKIRVPRRDANTEKHTYHN
jgi:hypothetical protein